MVGFGGVVLVDEAVDGVPEFADGAEDPVLDWR